MHSLIPTYFLLIYSLELPSIPRYPHKLYTFETQFQNLGHQTKPLIITDPVYSTLISPM
jgi:hypothetical protein